MGIWGCVARVRADFPYIIFYFSFVIGILLSVPAERSGDGALDFFDVCASRQIQSGVALRLPPHSKNRR
jgi:hypothetical protein